MDLSMALKFVGICIPFLLATIWALVDCAQRDFADLRTKVIWMVVAGIPFIGFIIYLAFGLRKGKKP
jgi:uncharacterized membrane protein YhaH (DUF805 family)